MHSLFLFISGVLIENHPLPLPPREGGIVKTGPEGEVPRSKEGDAADCGSEVYWSGTYHLRNGGGRERGVREGSVGGWQRLGIDVGECVTFPLPSLSDCVGCMTC